MSDELDAIQAVASDDVDEIVLLRPSSRTILLLAMQRLPRSPDAWLNPRNPLDDVSQAEFDDLEAIMDNAIYDVMTGVAMYTPPVGSMMYYPVGDSAPSGWMTCHGQVLASADYPELFALIGTTYGGGGGNFLLPDLRGRFLVVAHALATGYEVGDTGGAETVTLTEAQMPAHTHQNGRGNAGSAHSSWTAANVGSYISFQTSESAGGDEPHENRPPYMAMEMIMYVGV